MSVDLKCLEMYGINATYICSLVDEFGHGAMTCVCLGFVLILLVMSDRNSVQCGVLC
jgi:hypothetical protein